MASTKLIVTARESVALWDAIVGRRLATSRVVVVEVTKAVKRVDPEASPEMMLARLPFVELDAELATAAAAAGASDCEPSTPTMLLPHSAWASNSRRSSHTTIAKLMPFVSLA